MKAMQTTRPRFALSYYLGMFLILFFLLCSLLRHFADIRLEEALLLIALGATIIFAIFAAWRASNGGG
jgi:Kef-type K+ transport system membrane component KefB